METNALDIEITEENLHGIEQQMIAPNEVASIDCMALNPLIADQVNSSGHRPGEYELIIYKIVFDGQDIFLLYFDDAEFGGVEEFAARASFFETEADAKAAMGAEYNDWLTRF